MRARRRLTRLLGWLLEAAVAPWGRAIAREADAIEDDTEALLFLAGAVLGLGPVLVGRLWRHPRRLGWASAIGSVGLGLCYLTMAGAPARMLGVNAGALVLGLVASALLRRSLRAVSRWPAVTTLGLAGVLLLTALLGARVEGAARWVHLGGLMVQPSLVFLPASILVFARWRSWGSLVALALTAAALALQPDRAMAAVLAGPMLVLAVLRLDRWSLAAAALSVAGLLVALVQADTLPARPFVDQILWSSFAVHPLAGVAVLGGSLVLLLPALAGTGIRVELRAVFATIWLVMVVAAALGNSPTPVVGYSGGAVLGYALSLAVLPGAARARRRVTDAPATGSEGGASNGHLRVGWR